MTEEQGHGGFRNYETWSVDVIIDNDRRTHYEVRDLVRHTIEHGEPSEVWTEEERRRFQVADALKDWVERSLETSTAPNEAEPMSYLVSQLVHAALSEVDWHGLADSYIEEVTQDA